MWRDARIVRHRAEDVARWRSAGLWADRTIPEELHAVARARPGALAVASEEGRLTYAELDAESDRIAAGLRGLGLEPGDPVLFQVSNRLEIVPTWYGVLKAGLVPVCTLAPHREHEIRHIGRAVGARAHIVDAGGKFDLVGFALERAAEDAGEAGEGGAKSAKARHVLSVGRDPRVLAVADLEGGSDARAVVASIQEGLRADDVAVFQLSGGTTGTPKLIPRFHAEYWYNARAYAEALGWTHETRIAHVLPLIHNAGISCALHAAHAIGACLLLGTPDLPASTALLAREGVTDILVGHGHFLGAKELLPPLSRTLRGVILSGAKPPPALFDALAGAGAWVGQLFGMAEGFFAVSRADAPEEARRGTVGTALSPFDEVVILEPGSETRCPDGVVGELCCRGPYTLVGYFDAEEHNARAFTTDGYYRTGDLAKVVVMDGDRHLSIEGRLKDVINRGGEKVSADEVEALLVRMPEVAMAAVVAMPDPRLGERACAFMVPTGAPASLEQVRAHLAALGVAKFKWPERLEWREDLPRSNVNKIDKRALRVEIARLVVEESASGAPSSQGGR